MGEVFSQDTAPLVVDFGTETYPAYPRANGFLFGITPDSPSDEWITPLKPPAFRFNRTGRNDVYDRIKNWKVQKQCILSDMYSYPPWNARPRPGTDNSFAVWEALVKEMVQKNMADGWKGADIEYDIWNEGDFPQFWDGSRADLQETWVQAAKIIREMDPDALLVGPSFAFFTVDGINAFLKYAKEQGVLPDIVSWHENHPYPEVIEQHIEAYRKSPDALVKRIQINEYGWTNETFIPGYIVHYLANLDRAQVDVAMRGCWTKCSDDNTLSGLLTDDLKPTAAWWVHKYYADVTTPGNKMIKVLPGQEIDALASYSADKKMYLLIGNKSTNGLDLTVILKGLPAIDWKVPQEAIVNTLPGSTRTAVAEPAGKNVIVVSKDGNDSFTLKIPAHSAVFVQFK